MLLKLIIPIAFLALGVSCAPGSALLGAKECTWGPSYWCKNLTSAHGCHAVTHCIQTVWEHKPAQNDPDDICTLCKNMVNEARDQLESNMTMDEMKQVFEGTCKVLYVQPAVDACDKVVDGLVPELVEAISSQMNPEMCCTVAGLCNNAEIDKALDENKGNHPKGVKELQRANCNICEKFVKQAKTKVDKMESTDIMAYLLDICGKMSSYSDSCASIALGHFELIEKTIRAPVVPDEFCFISGSCLSTRPVVPGDETCDLCKQLVLHFKDIVTANTTDLEFRKILHGVCKQTGKFAGECNALVDEYSNELFNIISKDLNGGKICAFLNICPAPGAVYVNGPISPMIPSQPIPIKDENRMKISYGDSISMEKPLPEQLLINKMPVSLLHDTDVNGQQTCVFCQYVLHYIQKVITQPYGEDAIKNVLDTVCEELPKSVNVECRDFINLYGDALVAVLAQEIDPSQVCPGLKVCPAKTLQDKYEIEQLGGKPGCPLCLMAISALDEELADNKTEDAVKDALKRICDKLPQSLVSQCDSLVKEYTQELVDMIVADFTPEEVCSYLKICKKPGQVALVRDSEINVSVIEPYEIRTNEVSIPEIDEKTAAYKENIHAGPVCILCEFILEKIESIMSSNKTETNVDAILHTICSELPKTVREDCNQFVTKYADAIINTLALVASPQMVCSAMGVCVSENYKGIEKTIDDCAMCAQIAEIQKLLVKGEDIDTDRTNFLLAVCDGVNDNEGHQCREFMKQHGVMMFNAYILSDKSSDICTELKICAHGQTAKVVVEKRREVIVGADKCTHGPGYWCKSRANALSCGKGAVKHCQDNVWPF